MAENARILSGNWQNADDFDVVDEALRQVQNLQKDYLEKIRQESRTQLLTELKTAGNDAAKQLQAALKVAQDIQKKQAAAQADRDALAMVVQNLQEQRDKLLAEASEETVEALAKRQQRVADEFSAAGRALMVANQRLVEAKQEAADAQAVQAASQQNAALAANVLAGAVALLANAPAVVPVAPAPLAAPVAPAPVAAPAAPAAAAAPAAPVAAAPAPAPAAPVPAAAPAAQVAAYSDADAAVQAILESKGLSESATRTDSKKK